MRKMVSFWLEGEEVDLFDSLQRRLQEREGSFVKVTQRLLVLRALERLEAHLTKLDRERPKR